VPYYFSTFTNSPVFIFTKDKIPFVPAKIRKMIQPIMGTKSKTKRGMAKRNFTPNFSL
jgi:hypothetical protein